MGETRRNLRGMNGLGLFGCKRQGDILDVHGLHENKHDIIMHRELRSGDELVLVRQRGRSYDSFRSGRGYDPTSYMIWRLVPINGGWSFDCPLDRQPRVRRSTFDGWYRIEETLWYEEPGRKRSIVKDMEREVIETALRSLL